jgi:outer membrane protein assembly factor BamD
MFKIRLLFVGLSIILMLGGCRFQKLLKSSDYEAKYAMAIEFYEQKDYSRALQLMDQIVPIFKGTDKAQDLEYMYAMSYFKQSDYILAGYYFKRYYRSYPTSENAENALYFSAYCNYMDSPRSSLDQESTKVAIQEMKLFIARFPDSEKAKLAKDILLELETKLEKKEYDIARQYYKMEDYNASITAFKTYLKNYPETQYREDVLFYILKSYYDFAELSFSAKQEERFTMAIGSYVDLLALFPETKYKKPAEEMYIEASKFIGREFNEENKTN